MMKAFRRRFIILNMSLVGIVLLAAFVVIGTIICGNECNELKNTMSNVLKPWNTENAGIPGSGRTRENREKPPLKTEHDEKMEDAPSSKDNSIKKNSADKKREHNNNITTIFYYQKEKKVSVLSDETVFEGDPEEIVNEIISQKDDFGAIGRYHIIFYREAAGDIVRIAVCNEDYIGSRILRTVLLFSLFYLLSIALLFIISIRLAGFAERPLRQSIEMERKFVADISHDLKTPITVIMANNSILKSNKDSSVADNMQWIESTDRASEDMMHLIGNMLTMSSLDAQSQKMSTVPVDLSSAAERCILQFESVGYEKNVILEDSVEDDLTVYATDEYLKRICSSLIENALKYEPEGGKVTVRAYSCKHKVYFIVQNKNSRISPEDLPHLFDRFYRGDKARTQSAGHGLGLPIIDQMASLCSAQIQADSSENDGTVFTVVFRKA